jgi:hypothetical protein
LLRRSSLKCFVPSRTIERGHSLLFAIVMGSNLSLVSGANAQGHTTHLLPNEDIPEEVLQIQVIEQSNSHMDGGSRNAHEYALEQKQLRVKPEEVPARLAPQIKQTIDLLRIRKVIKSLLPFF